MMMGLVPSQKRQAGSKPGRRPGLDPLSPRNPLALSRMEPPCMTEETRDRHSVDPKLLEILVCPVTKGPLEYDADKQELISRAAKLAYPIRDGIPIMLPEEARPIE
jgi:uncharacterized protein YbaR (Trm112 family)